MKQLFRTLLIGSIIAGSAINTQAAFPFGSKKAEPKAKYVFLFIGDGMGIGPVQSADTYMREARNSSSPLLMMTFPVASQVRTYSASNIITDSSAAGTALSTGTKTNNYTVGIDPQGNPIYSISTDFIKAGYEVGIATTVAADDATPSAFYAHSAKRTNYADIANQAAGTGIKFYAGSKFRGAENNLEAFNTLMRKDGYNVVSGFSEFLALPTHVGKTVMTAPNPDGYNAGYTIDSIPGAMSTQQITQACLMTLNANLKVDKAPGFFMMVEAGNIDWACHSNDGGTVIKEVVNFQNAIDIAYKFYLDHPQETLIIVTADHDTGGMTLGRYDNGKPNMKIADYQKISKDKFEDYCRNNYGEGSTLTWNDMKKFLSEKLGFWNGVKLSEQDTERLKSQFEKTFVARESKDTKTLYKEFNGFASLVFDLFNKHLGAGFTSYNHTSNFVPLYAIGAGSNLFKGNLNNIEIPMLILKAAGLERPAKK